MHPAKQPAKRKLPLKSLAKKKLHSLSLAFSLHRQSPHSLLKLPNELLHEIAEYLQVIASDLCSWMRTCRRMSEVGAHIRYRSIIVSGIAGRRLLTTLLTGTPTSLLYCDTVLRLWFRGWNDSEMYLNSTLLCQVLPSLPRLMSLWIEASTLDTAHLVGMLRRSGVLRQNLHPAFSLLDIAKCEAASPFNLPMLRDVRLSGDSSLLSLTSHRPLVEIDITSILDHQEFAIFLSNSQSTVLSSSLLTLGLKVCREMDMSLGLPLLSSTFPNLRRLSLEQTGLNFQVALNAIAFAPDVLKFAQVLAFNRRFSHPISVHGRFKAPMLPTAEEMDDFVSRIAYARTGFQGIGFGRHIWRIGNYGKTVKVVMDSNTDWWRGVFGEQLQVNRFPIHGSPYIAFIPVF